MTETDLLQALFPIIQCFEHLGIPYFIGGSIASSVYGIARATIDIDLETSIKIDVFISD
jgi:hypothetical protein